MRDQEIVATHDPGHGSDTYGFWPDTGAGSYLALSSTEPDPPASQRELVEAVCVRHLSEHWIKQKHR